VFFMPCKPSLRLNSFLTAFNTFQNYNLYMHLLIETLFLLFHIPKYASKIHLLHYFGRNFGYKEKSLSSKRI
jgi:hypothetical protein